VAVPMLSIFKAKTELSRIKISISEPKNFYIKVLIVYNTHTKGNQPNSRT
jgi:hypothetical protein